MLLTGDLQRQIYAAFRGKLLKGVIVQNGGATTTDAHGDPVGLKPVTTRIEGFTDSYSDSVRAAAGIPSTDLKIMIFAGSCPKVTPGTDDMVMFQSLVGGKIKPVWYQLRGPILTDPATAMWTSAGFPIAAPVAVIP